MANKGRTSADKNRAILVKKNPGDSNVSPYRGLIILYFRPEVLDKYGNNKYWLISSDSISFLGLDGETILIVEFMREDGRLMVRARDYAFVRLGKGLTGNNMKFPIKRSSHSH